MFLGRSSPSVVVGLLRRGSRFESVCRRVCGVYQGDREVVKVFSGRLRVLSHGAMGLVVSRLSRTLKRRERGMGTVGRRERALGTRVRRTGTRGRSLGTRVRTREGHTRRTRGRLVQLETRLRGLEG